MSNNGQNGNGGNGNGGNAKKAAELLRGAEDDGVLSPRSTQVLALVDPGAQIQAALGVSVDDVQASEVLLVTMMPDDSGSIRFAGNAQAVRDGHNLVLAALARSKQGDNVLAHTRYLNGTILYPYCPIDQALRMDSQNYDPSLGTPLYDQALLCLGTVIAKAQEFADAGVAVRTVTLLITDGADEGSRRARAADVAQLVRDMGRAEIHTVAAMGISDGKTDFRRIFREMGIEDRWILTPGSGESEVRRAFQVFSQSAVQLGQGAFTGGLAGFVN